MGSLHAFGNVDHPCGCSKAWGLGKRNKFLKREKRKKNEEIRKERKKEGREIGTGLVSEKKKLFHLKRRELLACYIQFCFPVFAVPVKPDTHNVLILSFIYQCCIILDFIQYMYDLKCGITVKYPWNWAPG